MNLIDLVAAAYAAVSAARGSQRGVADEGYRLLRLVMAFLGGCGLFTLFHKALNTLLASTLGDAGGLGFAAGLGVVFLMMRRLRSSAVSLLQRQFAEKWNRMGGAVAGLMRALTAVAALVGFLQMSPWIPGGKSAAGDSLVGRVVGLFMQDNSSSIPR